MREPNKELSGSTEAECEPDAWAQCIRMLRPRALAYLRTLPCSVNERTDLFDDAVGAAFIAGVDLPKEDDPWASFLPFVRDACSRQMSHWRKQQYLRDFDAVMESIPATVAPADHRDLLREVLHCIALLPGQQRLTIELRFGEQLGYREIAQRLSTTPGSARASVCIGLARIRHACTSTCHECF